MPYRPLLHQSAADDLRRLSVPETAVVAARIVSLIQQLNADPTALGKLLDHGFGKFRTEDIDVSKFLKFWNKGKDLWRLKVWELEDQGFAYRVLYAYVPATHRFHILAVVHRDFNYDSSHPITQRILKDLDDL